MRRTLVCLVSILALAPPCWPQSPPGSRGRPRAGAKPFPALEGRPASKILVADWLNAAKTHEPGQFDAPARLALSWNASQMADLLAAFKKATPALLGLSDQAHKTNILERIVVLHTDVAVLTVPDAPDSAWVSRTAGWHLAVALDLVDWSGARTRSDDNFVHGWYRTVAAFLLSKYEITSAPRFMELAVERFPRDADLLLLAGAVHEVIASPRIQDNPDLRDAQNCGAADDNLDAAEYFYRAALRENASFGEARMRLGRVVGQRGRHAEALTELTAAATTVPPAVRYFLCLFLGEENAALARPEPARAAYARAIELRPDAEFAYLALTSLERGAGNRTTAAGVLGTMLVEQQRAPAAFDLWAEYYAAGDARRLTDVLAEFREPFRRR